MAASKSISDLVPVLRSIHSASGFTKKILRCSVSPGSKVGLNLTSLSDASCCLSMSIMDIKVNPEPFWTDDAAGEYEHTFAHWFTIRGIFLEEK